VSALGLCSVFYVFKPVFLECGVFHVFKPVFLESNLYPDHAAYYTNKYKCSCDCGCEFLEPLEERPHLITMVSYLQFQPTHLFVSFTAVSWFTQSLSYAAQSFVVVLVGANMGSLASSVCITYTAKPSSLRAIYFYTCSGLRESNLDVWRHFLKKMRTRLGSHVTTKSGGAAPAGSGEAQGNSYSPDSLISQVD
jgi:hypothetical protein